MYKSLSFFLLLLILAAPRLGASALDNISRIELGKNAAAASRASAQGTFRSMIIEIDDDGDLTELENMGAVIFHRRENLLLVCLPTDALPALNNVAGLRRCSLSRKATALLDKALPVAHVPEVISGQQFALPYSGKGVTVGFSDCGFDPGHIAFDGRVKKLAHFVDSTASLSVADTPADVALWTTDTPLDTHATHVGGILAGNDISSPYRGVARGAEIVATTSVLEDIGILIGVEEIIARAKADGQPAVINLSLGSTIGPHDGTDLFCRYLDFCAEDAAILLSAGNDGRNNIHIGHTFTSSVPEISVMINSTNWGNVMYHGGYLDLWSGDGRPIDVRFRVYDRFTGEIVWTSAWSQPDADGELTFPAANGFDTFFEGMQIAVGELSSANGRYNLSVGMDMFSTTYFPEKSWSRFSPVIDFRGALGASIDLFVAGNIAYYPPSSSYPWVTGGDSQQSISAMACGKNTICVGSSTSRDIVTLISGETRSWQSSVTAGTVSEFSSYGTTPDGRSLPHFCAPGAYVVSAMNRYYYNEGHADSDAIVAESGAAPGHFYYATAGTSMSSPLAAGIFALWLEADPSLTGPQLREIAQRSASTDVVDMSDPRSGAGMINAAAGLKIILGEQGVVDPEYAWVDLRREGSRLIVNGIDAEKAVVEVYTLSGQLIFHGNVSGASLPSGAVVVKLSSPSATVVRKLL